MPHNPDSAAHDWRTATGDVLDLIADMLGSLTPERWESPSLDAGWRIKDVAGHIVWRVGTPTRQLLASGSKAYLGKHLNPMKAIDDVSILTAQASYGDLVRDLRLSAEAHRSGRGRKNFGELAEAVVHGFDMSNALGFDLSVNPSSTEAVARSRMKLSPKNVRSVLKNRTLVATDAGWRIGRGDQWPGTAEAIVLFLCGRRPLAGGTFGPAE
ncbi:maleylpyruvate isomerase family mycothiol-dependent enzyme [Homoserinimonas sp. OAct 916]|uniref:maleylpyruvate isomerase family mycothiol-dependent enzyme n=1 Tax=Homoserinimonas sp. OAct 916 TaxID=2211450 RepID=UPI000DBE7A96|nr:maleylpyruvate isomerase family mycothiol-dependent enzyme [Homoserinimonas sp. OAct 916]